MSSRPAKIDCRGVLALLPPSQQSGLSPRLLPHLELAFAVLVSVQRQTRHMQARLRGVHDQELGSQEDAARFGGPHNLEKGKRDVQVGGVCQQ